MDIINTNHLRISIRGFRRGYSERFGDFSYGAYHSSDHGKAQPETNYFAHALGIVANVKLRPDGKR